MHTNFNRFCFYIAVPVRNGSSVPGCFKSEFCQCYLYDCLYGNPCICQSQKFRGECPVNEYFVYEGNKPCKKLFFNFVNHCVWIYKKVELETVYICSFSLSVIMHFKILKNKKIYKKKHAEILRIKSLSKFHKKIFANYLLIEFLRTFAKSATQKNHLYKYGISFFSINLFIIVYTYTDCKQCPPGTKKEKVGCGPCQTIPVTPDSHISTTTEATKKPITASGLFINHNYSATSAREPEIIGLFICFWWPIKRWNFKIETAAFRFLMWETLNKTIEGNHMSPHTCTDEIKM